METSLPAGHNSIEEMAINGGAMLHGNGHADTTWYADIFANSKEYY